MRLRPCSTCRCNATRLSLHVGPFSFPSFSSGPLEPRTAREQARALSRRRAHSSSTRQGTNGPFRWVPTDRTQPPSHTIGLCDGSHMQHGGAQDRSLISTLSNMWDQAGSLRPRAALGGTGRTARRRHPKRAHHRSTPTPCADAADANVMSHTRTAGWGALAVYF